MIDKDKGQLLAIKNMIPQIFVSSLAKKEEQLFCQRFPEGIILDKQSKTGLLIIFICNDKNNFALSYDQKLAKKNHFEYNRIIIKI